MTTIMKTTVLFFALCANILPLTSAHVQMSEPVPLRSSFHEQTYSGPRDYNMMAPLLSDGSDYPCKGYHKDTSVGPTATYEAGGKYTVTLAGSATHLGGSCQLSLSYDGGATFKVIKSMIGGCPLTPAYDFTIPAFAPSGKALFAWSWLNYEGNREFYMNCAEVEITNAASGTTGSMDSLPNIWVANLAGVNTCQLDRALNAVFPRPGDDIVYANGMSSSSPVSPGDCDGAGAPASGTPDGPPAVDEPQDSAPSFTPQPGNFAEGAAPSLANPTPSASNAGPVNEGSTTVATAPVNAPTEVISSAVTTTTPTDNGGSITSVNPGASSSAPNAPADQSTPTVEPTATCTGPIASCDCLPGYTCSAVNACSTVCALDASATETTLVTSVSSSASTSPTTLSTGPSSTAPPPTATDIPPYATNDPSTYLPCVPGKILCTAPNAFLTCQPSSATEWTYGAVRAIADGMLCKPFLSPFTNQTTQFSSDPGAPLPSGSYRDDRYVRAQPYGSCGADGGIECVDAGLGMGSGFLVCDQGGWVDMGRVADGTVCVDGEIVAV